jgi:hypothetical protein
MEHLPWSVGTVAGKARSIPGKTVTSMDAPGDGAVRLTMVVASRLEALAPIERR